MYKMQEVEHVNSFKDNSKHLKAKTLTSAKREASRKQVFQGTVLRLYEENVLVSIKIKTWEDISRIEQIKGEY